MSGYSNLPDNIRDFDHDPRSPFYDDSQDILRERLVEDETDEVMGKGSTSDFDLAEIISEVCDSSEADTLADLVANIVKPKGVSLDMHCKALTVFIREQVQKHIDGTDQWPTDGGD